MKDACLSCALPICDDKDARCAFVQIEKSTYYRETYYPANREQEIARVRKWEQENKEYRNAYRRDLRKRKREAMLDETTSTVTQSRD